jgi:hypothetical protein
MPGVVAFLAGLLASGSGARQVVVVRVEAVVDVSLESCVTRVVTTTNAVLLDDGIAVSLAGLTFRDEVVG